MNYIMNENKAKIIVRNRKWGRVALAFEAIYAVVLFFTLLFNFGLFAHLIVIQFFVTLAYFVSGWGYDFYIKHIAKSPINNYQNKETFVDKFSKAFPHKADKNTFYHFLAIIDLIAGIGMMIQIVGIMYYDLTLKTNSFDILDSMGLYVNLIYLFGFLGIVVGLLMNYRRMIRNTSVLVIIASIFLAIYWPHFLTTYIVGLAVGIVGLTLYLKRKII